MNSFFELRARAPLGTVLSINIYNSNMEEKAEMLGI